MIKHINLIIIFSIFFVSCTNSSVNYFNKNSFDAKAIQFTKKIDIKKNNQNEIEVIFWATYINKVEKEYIKNEVFLISLYFPNSNSQNQLNNNYNLLLNKNKYISIKEINKDNKKFKSLIKKNPWGKNYLVEFKELKKVYDLNLTIFNKNKKAIINFKK